MASRVFAVDLGAWSVKLAVASPGLRGAQLLNVVERLVPPGDEPTDERSRRVLHAMLQELRLEDDPGYIGVAGDAVFTQILEFGFKSLRRTDLEKAVGGELEGVVPIDLEDMVFAFEQIPVPPALDLGVATPVAGTQRGRVAAPAEGMRVLSYAMHRERASSLIALGKAAGFEPRGILPAGGAATKLVAHIPSLERARTDGAVAVIDIGHDRTDLVVVQGGKAVFSRSIARAGKAVTQAIANFWRLDFDKAEAAKHADGFIGSTSEPPTNEQWTRIHNVLIQELSPFARDVRQTLAACRARTGFTPIAALLVGGGARLRGLGSFMTEQLGIPAWRMTPEDASALCGLRLGPVAHELPIDAAAMTIGMAYDAAGGRPQFDLRSGDLAVRVDLSFLRAKAVPLGAALLAVCAFASISAYADLYRLKKAEKTLTTRLAAETQEQFGSAKSAKDVLALNGPGGGPGNGSPMAKLSAYDVLLEINAHIPPKDKITVDVDKLDIDAQKVELSGTAKSPEEIDLLVSELKKVECFNKEVNRGATETGDNGVKKFKLTINAQCM